jgi:hypothetical protein
MARAQLFNREPSPLIPHHQAGGSFDDQQQFTGKLLIQTKGLTYLVTTESHLGLQTFCQGGRQAYQGWMA